MILLPPLSSKGAIFISDSQLAVPVSHGAAA